MGFWKRQKSKILIGGALLAIASGALGILKNEEARLEKEIVGCERVIGRETRDWGVPEDTEKMQKLQTAIQERKVLQTQQEETKASEEELQQVISDIKHLEDYDVNSENEMLKAEYRNIDKPLELINILEKFRDETLQELVEYYKRLAEYKDPYNRHLRGLGWTKPEVPPSIQELIPEDPYIKKHFKYFLEDIELKNADYDKFLKIVYEWAIIGFKGAIEGKEVRVKYLDENVKSVSFRLLQIIKSGRFGKELESHTAKVNEVNEAIDKNLTANQEFIEYVKAKIEYLRNRAKRRGIDL